MLNWVVECRQNNSLNSPVKSLVYYRGSHGYFEVVLWYEVLPVVSPAQLRGLQVLLCVLWARRRYLVVVADIREFGYFFFLH